MKKKWMGLLTILVLTAGFCISKPMMSGASPFIDLTKSCSLRVHPAETGAFGGDLEDADVVLDLYLIAKAAERTGYDTYDYEFTGVYQEFSVTSATNTADWKAMAQKAAQIVLDSGNSQIPEREGLNAGEKTENLTTGLYLLIARGDGLADYQTEIENDEGEKLIATIARTDRYTYTFEPTLISLPMKDAVQEEGTQDPVYDTSNPGDWQYDWEVTLKPEQSPRYGTLEIVKELTNYETKEPAIFVFSVDAVLDGRPVYSDVESIIFTSAGEQKTLVKTPLPAGAEVTVKEIYTGSVYHLTTAASEKKTITADTVVQVNFANDYEEEQRGGHGIINDFEYRDGKWNHTPVRTPSGADMEAEQEEDR